MSSVVVVETFGSASSMGSGLFECGQYHIHQSSFGEEWFVGDMDLILYLP